MWLPGGGTYDTPGRPRRSFNNDVWSSADGASWELHVRHAPWAPRQYHEVAAFDGRLWVLEGWNGRNRNDVHFSADGAAWHELPDTPWAPRHAASVFVYDGGLWVVAGNNMVADVWKLTPAAGRAAAGRRLSPERRPAARRRERPRRAPAQGSWMLPSSRRMTGKKKGR
jgi:hypothetical protein